MERGVKATGEDADGQAARSEDYFSRQSSTSISSRLTPYSRRAQPESARPRLAAIQSPTSPTSPKTPRTPLLGRSFSPGFNSPGQGVRVDDDIFVFEFGARYLRAGLAGESRPRCQLSFSPESQKRAGDYAPCLPPISDASVRKHETLDTWDSEHILWRMDLRNLDLGLVADKLERALRTAITEYLLVMDDSKKRKLMLALPPAIPHPLLSTLLTTLFTYHPVPSSITLMSSPVLCAIGAGLRSALVLDIGWSNTVASAVYEYREVQHKRSCRAVRLVSWEIRSMLNDELSKVLREDEIPEDISFEVVEEVLQRMVWCKRTPGPNTEESSDAEDSIVDVPVRAGNFFQTLHIPFNCFHRPIETAFFASGETAAKQDDHELPIPFLIYSTLLSLPIDVRKACISRIVITGGGSNIPGLKSRIISDLATIISHRGWDPVHNYGSARQRPSRRTTVRSSGATPVSEHAVGAVHGNEHVNKDIDESSTTAAHSQPPLPDPVIAAVRSHSAARRFDVDQASTTKSSASALGFKSDLPHSDIWRNIRCYKTLGAWEGASLMAGLRLRGIAEVDRDKFMQHGLSSGMRAGDTKRQSVQQAQNQRASLGGVPGANFSKGVEQNSQPWTLGVWA